VCNDPAATCSQDQVWDWPWLAGSNTVFANLGISGTFSEGARVFPEVGHTVFKL
jgi:hypothetical protein